MWKASLLQNERILELEMILISGPIISLRLSHSGLMCWVLFMKKCGSPESPLNGSSYTP